ncbi:Fe-S cluster assembly protein SufD [Gardnerella vaginalis]|uniref:Fe-S cluster assembly protein SufD n=1 Tax=Gardnerella vaginalis TaxID=2702 RepID=UPI000C7DC9A1|nr:Fe-S cluster assembly protein SufD [Gardnerella vaginalis]PKZ53959.1 Fe-S cluster assembly protein SufD [Gardnerella vaginalis]PKZ56069.1 Fe-S cluster assembly protein SufD [Gardnerella vaginalis]
MSEDLKKNLGNKMTEKEINIPVADPNDPYAVPAAMPSSADKSVRSFNVQDFTIPTRKQEDWRYTPVERISEFFDSFKPSNNVAVELKGVDGDSHVTMQILPKNEAPHTEMKPSDRVAAVAWNSAKSAYVLHVCGEVTKPIILQIHGNLKNESTLQSLDALPLDALHLVIEADSYTNADIIVEHTGVAKLAEVVEIILGDNAHVSTTFIQEWDSGSKHVGNHRIHVGQGASLRHTMVTLGGDVVRIRMDQDFGGEKGDLNMLGMYFVDPGEHVEHRTMVVHNHPECKSRVVYKGALYGKGAHSTWVGNALIKPEAPGTDSYELNRNLVLTPGAIADSEPNLEIENGNIIGAGHASSVGRFDDEELFYLQSRGVSEADARKLVVRGFFNELIEEIGVPQIVDHLMAAIERRLAKTEESQAAAESVNAEKSPETEE